MKGYIARHARNRSSRLRLAVLGAAMITAGSVSANADTWWSPTRPMVFRGAPEERLVVEPIWVRVNDVRATTSVINDEGELDTSGAWIVVDLTAAAVSSPEGIERLAVRDGDGREYFAASRVPNPMLDGLFEPGIPERGDVVFEVPTDALGDLTLRVMADSPHLWPRAIGEIALQTGEVEPEAVGLRQRRLQTGSTDAGEDA